MPTGVTFVSIDVGSRTTCALTAAGQAYCWGDNNYGQLGNGQTGLQLGWSTTPVAVQMPVEGMGTAAFTNISTSGSTTCAVSHYWGCLLLGIKRFGASREWWRSWGMVASAKAALPKDVNAAKVS